MKKINASNHSNRASLIQNWLTAINYVSVTGIETVKATADSAKGIYTLSGQRLSEAPAHSVYIVNGKRIIRYIYKKEMEKRRAGSQRPTGSRCGFPPFSI